MSLLATSCNSGGVIYNIPRDLSNDPEARANRAHLFGIFLVAIVGVILISFCHSCWKNKQVCCTNGVSMITDQKSVADILFNHSCMLL